MITNNSSRFLAISAEIRRDFALFLPSEQFIMVPSNLTRRMRAHGDRYFREVHELHTNVGCPATSENRRGPRNNRVNSGMAHQVAGRNHDGVSSRERLPRARSLSPRGPKPVWFRRAKDPARRREDEFAFAPSLFSSIENRMYMQAKFDRFSHFRNNSIYKVPFFQKSPYSCFKIVSNDT